MSLESQRLFLGGLLLTTKELALVLKCGETKAKALIGSGEIPSVKIAGLRRVRANDLAAYLDNFPPSPPARASRTVQAEPAADTEPLGAGAATSAAVTRPPRRTPS